MSKFIIDNICTWSEYGRAAYRSPGLLYLIPTNENAWMAGSPSRIQDKVISMIQDLVLYVSCMIFLIVIVLGILYVEWYLPREKPEKETGPAHQTKPATK
jgi:hypothetical protein